jgi:hypothetical protein
MSEQSDGYSVPVMLLVTWQVHVVKADAHAPFTHLSMVVAAFRPVPGVHRKPPLATVSPYAPPRFVQPPFGGGGEPGSPFGLVMHAAEPPLVWTHSAVDGPPGQSEELLHMTAHCEAFRQSVLAPYCVAQRERSEVQSAVHRPNSVPLWAQMRPPVQSVLVEQRAPTCPAPPPPELPELLEPPELLDVDTDVQALWQLTCWQSTSELRADRHAGGMLDTFPVHAFMQVESEHWQFDSHERSAEHADVAVDISDAQ